MNTRSRSPRKATFLRRLGWLATAGIAGVALLGPAAGSAAATKPEPSHKVTICHRTNSTTNPYTIKTVDVASVDGSLNANDSKDHSHHNGPLFDPTNPPPPPHNGDQWGDIIPPFYEDGTPGYWTSKNWPAGKTWLENDCNDPAPTPTPTASPCGHDEDGVANDDDHEGCPTPTPTASPCGHDEDGVANDDDHEGCPTPTPVNPTPTPVEPTPTPVEPTPTPVEPTPTPVEPTPTPVTPTPTPVNPTPTPVDPTPTPVDPTPTPVNPTPTPVNPTPTPNTPTNPPNHPTEPPFPSFPTEPPASPQTEPPTVPPTTPPTTQPTGSVEAVTSSPAATDAPQGGVAGVTGKPNVTPPPTSTGGTPGTPSDGTWRIVLLAIAGLLATILVLTPATSRRR